MNARRIGYLAVVVTAAASMYYFFVYLTRWEWNRALTSGVIFLAAEIGLFGALALDRIGKLRSAITAQSLSSQSGASRSTSSQPGSSQLISSQSISSQSGAARAARSEPRPQVLARLRETAPVHHDHFAWLKPTGTNVFVPVLLGAGVIVSAIAWVVERVARATAGRSMERRLAVRLESLQPPVGGLITVAPDPFALFAPAPAPISGAAPASMSVLHAGVRS